MSDKAKILDMVEKGSITAQDAARLLECLGETTEKEEKAQQERVHESAVRMKGKKLRVEVNGYTEGNKVNVNVSVPLVLARYADNIIANCVPDAVNGELKGQGIDLRSLNIGGIIDTFEEIDEDIVNVEIDEDDTKMKVRVYVE